MANGYIRYDIEGFAQDMEVDLLTVSALYSEYFSEMKNNIEDCREYLEKKDWGMFQGRIHNMKGISSTLRIDDVYTIASALDEDFKRGEYRNADEEILKIIGLLNSVEKDIREFFKFNNISI